MDQKQSRMYIFNVYLLIKLNNKKVYALIAALQFLFANFLT